MSKTQDELQVSMGSDALQLSGWHHKLFTAYRNIIKSEVNHTLMYRHIQ